VVANRAMYIGHIEFWPPPSAATGFQTQRSRVVQIALAHTLARCTLAFRMNVLSVEGDSSNLDLAVVRDNLFHVLSVVQNFESEFCRIFFVLISLLFLKRR
jgi:hypothetical protein